MSETNRPVRYYLDGDRVIATTEDDPRARKQLMEPERRRQGGDYLTFSGERLGREVGSHSRNCVWVSTVFVGIDLSYPGDPVRPLFFETMVFGGDLAHRDFWREHALRRYATAAEARAGHEEMVEHVATWLRSHGSLEGFDDDAGNTDAPTA